MMKKSLFYIFAITCAFTLGATSVLWVDSIRNSSDSASREYSESAIPLVPTVPSAPSSEQGLGETPITGTAERAVVQEISSFAQAVEIAAPAVVNVFTSRTETRQPNISPFFEAPFNNPFFDNFFGQQRGAPEERIMRSLGSGVVIESNGLIVTNNHVISNADDILVALRDGREARAEVIGVDPETDIAVLQIEMSDLPSLKFGDIEDVRVGDLVLAIGNPYAVGQTVTQGIISAIGRSDVGIATFENFLQTDAAINPGNSGGALINTKGELWGINTAIFSRSGGSQGIGFAIPVDLVLEIVEQIRTGGKVDRGWMGLYLRDVYEDEGNNNNQGAAPKKEKSQIYVAGVYRQSPAFDAGIMTGDEIINIDSQYFADTKELVRYVANKSPGEVINATIRRGESEIDIIITLSSRPNAE